MRCEEFLDRLPALFDGWGTPGARPIDGRFAALAGALPCLSAAGTLQLLNLAVAQLEPGELYCEAGTYRGCTLIGALTGNERARALALEDFSQFDADRGGRAELERNLERFGVRDRVELAGGPFQRHFLERRPASRIGVYLYDAAHDYRSQLLGLLLAVPFLADRALLVVDDANWAAPRQAAADFCACRPEARLALALPTPAVDHPSFWNGLHVLTWDRAAAADPAGRHERLAAQSEPGFIDVLHQSGFRYELGEGRIPAGRLPTDW